jgi:uncharacterized protein
MKSLRFQKRFYREWANAKDLRFTHLVAKESDLVILTNKTADKEYISEQVRLYRWDIENYISRDPRFLVSLKPVNVEISAPKIIQEMARETRKVNVGPMASVAGAIAEFIGKDLLKEGFKDVIIENGGDIFLKTRKTRTVGLYAGRSKLWNKLSLKIKPKDTPLGICTSSGTIGHSLSFGSADSVVVLSKSTILADAVATATCNRVRTKDDLKPALDFARSIPGVLGIIIIVKNNLISWGKVEFSH